MQDDRHTPQDPDFNVRDELPTYIAAGTLIVGGIALMASLLL